MKTVRQPLLLRVITPLLAFMVRYNLGPVGKRLLVISYPKVKSGRQNSMPVGYLRVDGDFIVVDAGGNTQWYKNLQTMPDVRVHAQGGPFTVRVDFVNDPDEVAKLLDGCKEIYAGRYERFLGVPYDMPSEEAARSPNLNATFVRFRPVED